MSKGSNPTNVTTTTSAEPSEFVKPYVSEAFDQAQNLFQSATPNFYPNQTYTDFAPETNAAMQLATNRALNNPLLASSQSEINKILQGDYLSPTSNPYSQALYNQIAGDVTSGVQSQFSKAGRLGSAANQEVLASELGKVGTQVYGDQYNRERENMVNATTVAPQLAQADYTEIQALGGIGGGLSIVGEAGGEVIASQSALRSGIGIGGRAASALAGIGVPGFRTGYATADTSGVTGRGGLAGAQGSQTYGAARARAVQEALV